MKKIICPVCGEQNTDGTFYCETCGSEIPRKVQKVKVRRKRRKTAKSRFVGGEEEFEKVTGGYNALTCPVTYSNWPQELIPDLDIYA